MTTCVKIRGKRRKICIGDLDRQITLQTRKITPPSDAVDYTMVFDDSGVTESEVWAMIETVNGETLFDEHNVEQVVTHKFYIRFNADVTAETWILFNNDRFDILDVENLDERSEFMRLRANNRGTKDRSNNAA